MVLLEKRKINKSVRYNTTPTMKTRGRPPPSPSSGRKEEEDYDDDDGEEEDKKKNDIVGGRSFSSFPSSSSFAVIVPNKKIVSIVYPGYECMQNIAGTSAGPTPGRDPTVVGAEDGPRKRDAEAQA